MCTCNRYKSQDAFRTRSSDVIESAAVPIAGTYSRARKSVLEVQTSQGMTIHGVNMDLICHQILIPPSEMVFKYGFELPCITPISQM